MLTKEIITEGDRIAHEIIRRRREKVKGLYLDQEQFCKEKIWQSWFKAGLWVLNDQTMPWTAKVYIPDLPNSHEVFRMIRKQKPIPDATMTRGMFTILLDFKFKVNTKLGLWIEKEAYDDYYNKEGIFQLFIWANDRRKRYVHLVQNPSKYESKYPSDVEHYDVSDDCVEVPYPDVPIESLVPQSLIEEFAWMIKINDLASRGEYPKEITIGCEDVKQAEQIISGKASFLNIKRYKKVLRLKQADLARLDSSWIFNVLRSKHAHNKVLNRNVLGFDTEFNSETGELLSVQLALFDDVGKLHSTCITESLEGYDAKRLLVDSERFIQAHNVEVKDKIVLIAHFAIADIGHLANYLKQFRFKEIHRALHADILEADPNETEFNKTRFGKLKIIDLFAYYPTSLARIGDMINLPKLEIEIGEIERVKRENPKLFREYACRDAEIALKAFVELRELLWREWGVELFRCLTIASAADNVFRTRYLHKPTAPIKTLISVGSYKIKKGYSKRKVKTIVYDGDWDPRRLAMNAYWGGRAENYVHGFIEGDFTLYDVRSLYPTSAILQPLPNCDTEWIKLNRENIQDHEGFVKVKFRFPSETLYPCLPVHGMFYDRLYFPLEGVSYCTLAEIREAAKIKCEIVEFEGYGFKPSANEIEHDLKRYMQDFMKRKNEAKGLERETVKMLLNALIGKFAQRHAESDMNRKGEISVGHGIPYRKTLHAGPAWSPEWACLILGKARSLMTQFITKGALMTVTDSVLLPSHVNIECESLNLLRSVGSDLEVQFKNIKSALLIRTRLYTLLDANGEIIKEAHHAVHLTREQCKTIFKQSLADGVGVEAYGERLHIVGLKEAVKKSLPLGSSYMKPSRIYWRWDYKRVLNKRVENMFREYSWSKPIIDLKEFETIAFEAAKQRKRKKNVGRPRTLNDALTSLIKTLRNEGLSYRRIAEKLNVSLGMVQRAVKRGRLL